MQPLSTEARARLAAFRSAESPDPAIAERCLAALEQRLESGDDDRAAAEPPRRLAAPLAVAVALAAGVLLALTWAVTRGVSAPRSDVAAQYQSHDDPLRQLALPRAPEPSPRAPARVAAPTNDEPEAPAPEAPAPSPAAENPVAPDALAVDESPDAAAGPAAPEKPVPPDTSRPAPRRPARAEDTVAAEVDLLRRAKLAEPTARLALLKEHARRFPSGYLAAERELLVIETRCELNEVESARFLAERFMRRFPGSPLVERAATICGGPDSGP